MEELLPSICLKYCKEHERCLEGLLMGQEPPCGGLFRCGCGEYYTLDVVLEHKRCLVCGGQLEQVV